MVVADIVNYHFPAEELHKKRSQKTRLFYLSLFVLFSISLALIPHLSTLNKDNQQIGSDSETYVEWMTQLQQSKNLQDFLKSAFIDLMRGDRPLALIFLFLLTTIIDAPILDTIEYLPVILGPALVLVIYFLTRELTSNETASLFAAFLTGLGYFQVSIGIYAGFYANWIALVGRILVTDIFLSVLKNIKQNIAIAIFRSACGHAL